MRTKKKSGEYIIVEGGERYIETTPPTPTGKFYGGSRHGGYAREYKGRGTIDGNPVTAIYLVSGYQLQAEEENYDWGKALKAGRLIASKGKSGRTKPRTFLRQNTNHG